MIGNSDENGDTFFEKQMEIDEMQRVASQMLNCVSAYTSIPQSEYIVIVNDLKSDKFGIFVSVLLKHGKMPCIKDCIEKVD